MHLEILILNLKHSYNSKFNQSLKIDACYFQEVCSIGNHEKDVTGRNSGTYILFRPGILMHRRTYAYGCIVQQATTANCNRC